MIKISLLNFLTFLSAFLLFQIELITAKMLLPKYGGSYMVWGACMVFFQAALLAGYCFAHTLIQKIGINRGRWFFLVLLFVPFVFFPGRDFIVRNPSLGYPLSVDVFVQLLLTIGPVFFVLSTVSIFTQVWLSASTLPQRSNPYSLYGWSNLGSFAGLLTYPFLFEMLWDLKEQLLIWQGMYLLLVVLSLAVALVIRIVPQSIRPLEKGMPISAKDIRDWILLSAAGVILFLSVTNILTLEIAPIPLLWIIPLSVYLLAFVFNFKARPWCPSWIKNKIGIFLGYSLLFYFLVQHRTLPLVIEILIFVFILFVLTMYCQNQLVQRKPIDNRQLTLFFLIVATGGFLGGIVTSWIIPMISSSLSEFVLGLILISLTLSPPKENKVNSAFILRFIFYMFFILVTWPLFYQGYNFLGLLGLLIIVMAILGQLQKGRHALTFFLLLTLVLLPYIEMAWENKIFTYKKRNFYGIYKVFHEQAMTILSHGSILHGMQFMQEDRKQEPTSYFGINSPLGLIMLTKEFNFKKIGVVGLGVGTIASYGRVGQTIDFYELDPNVLTIAQKYFSFTNESAAKINFIFGDARFSLENKGDIKYDLLVVDAFSGDAVPVHLLTKEMMEIYRQHLTSQGVLLLHVSNRYLDLPSIADRTAKAMGAKACYQITKKTNPWEIASTWVAATWDGDIFEKLIGPLQWESRRQDTQLRVWTDQYTNVAEIFRWDSLLAPINIFSKYQRR